MNALGYEILTLVREDRLGEFVDRFHEDAVMELRFLPQGPVKLSGKLAIAKLMADVIGRYRHFDIQPQKIHSCDVGSTWIIEATSLGIPRDGTPYYQNRSCIVIRCTDGQISSWRTYLNPYPVLWSDMASDLASRTRGDGEHSRVQLLSEPADLGPVPDRSDPARQPPAGSANIAAVRAALEIVKSRDFDSMRVLLDENLVVEVPFQAFHAGGVQSGWAEFRNGLGFIPNVFETFEILAHEIYESVEAQTVFVDASSAGALVGGAGDYSNEYLLIFGFRSGKIQFWREYYNPLRMNEKLSVLV